MMMMMMMMLMMMLLMVMMMIMMMMIMMMMIMMMMMMMMMIAELHMEAFYQMNHKTNCFCLAEVWHIQIQLNEPATPSPFGCTSSMLEWSSLWQFFCHSAGDLKRRDASQRLLLNGAKNCDSCPSSQRNINNCFSQDYSIQYTRQFEKHIEWHAMKSQFGVVAKHRVSWPSDQVTDGQKTIRCNYHNSTRAFKVPLSPLGFQGMKFGKSMEEPTC